MAKKYWLRGAWIGAITGLILFILNILFDLINLAVIPMGYKLNNFLVYLFPVNFLIQFLRAPNYTAYIIINLVSAVLIFAIIGLLIGGLFKKGN